MRIIVPYKTSLSLIGLGALMMIGFCTQALATEPASSIDTAAIERLTGVKGTLDEKEGVFKVSLPRKDIAMQVGPVKMTPPMGLTAWAAFQRNGNSDMVMGDLVLLEDQVNPVMSVALDNGLQVTALHNHFIWTSPVVMFMHIGGMGPEEQLATAVGKVFAKIKEGMSAHSDRASEAVEIDPSKSTLDAGKLDEALALKGQHKDGVYKFTVGRKTRMHDVEVGNTMGVNTWGTFAGSEDKAVVDGDFAMHEEELQNVLRSLRGSGINIVAIHQHMTGEQPRIMFLHYWAIGRAVDLAKGLRAALDLTKD
jgi:hypothetical protein